MRSVYYVRTDGAEGTVYRGPFASWGEAHEAAASSGDILRRDEEEGPCIICGAYGGSHDPGCMDAGSPG